MSQLYSKAHLSILLASMLKDQQILESAMVLEPAFLNNPAIGGSQAQTIIFRIIKSAWVDYKRAPDLAMLRADLDAITARGKARPEIVESVNQEVNVLAGMVPQIKESSAPKVRELITYILKVCSVDPRIREIGADIAKNGASARTVAEITTLNNILTSSQGGQSICGLSTRPRPVAGGRMITGIPWLDAKFPEGEGPTRGSCAGIIAPQNGGKTTLGIQFIVSQALMGQHALLVLVEEGLSIPMQCKIFACALNVPWDKIQRHMGKTGIVSCGVAGVIEEYKLDKETSRKKIELIDTYFHVYDLCAEGKENLGIKSIAAEIAHLAATGRSPVMIYLDWAGLLAERMLAGIEVDREYKTKEDALKSIGAQFAAIAQRFNNFIVISQQMSTAIAGQPYRLFDTYCAADCKMFTQSMKYAFAIGKPDAAGLSVLSFIKARDDAKVTPLVLHLNGAHARFENRNDDYTFVPRQSGGKGRIVKAERNESAVPQEKRR